MKVRGFAFFAAGIVAFTIAKSTRGHTALTALIIAALAWAGGLLQLLYSMKVRGFAFFAAGIVAFTIADFMEWHTALTTLAIGVLSWAVGFLELLCFRCRYCGRRRCLLPPDSAGHGCSE